MTSIVLQRNVDPDVWREHLPQEKHDAYAARMHYLQAGPDRTLADVASRFHTVPEKTIIRWSKKFEWDLCANGFDEALQKQFFDCTSDQAKKLAEKMAGMQLRAVHDFLEFLQLEVGKHLRAAKETAYPTSKQRDLVSLLEPLAKIMRLIPSEKPGSEDLNLACLSDEELATLEGLMSKARQPDLPAVPPREIVQMTTSAMQYAPPRGRPPSRVSTVDTCPEPEDDRTRALELAAEELTDVL